MYDIRKQKLTAGNIHPVAIDIHFILMSFITEYIKSLFNTVFSGKNTPERKIEEVTYMNFIHYLDECEGTNFNIYVAWGG